MPPDELNAKYDMLRNAGHPFAAQAYFTHELKKLLNRIEEADWSFLDYELDLDELDEDWSDEGDIG